MIDIASKDVSPLEIQRLLTGGIAPRPIAFVSTISKEGLPNLAPFSFFNAFGSNPPMVAFSPARRGRDGSLKDTYRNLVDTKECVVHAVTFDIVEQMNLASTEYETGVDEFIKSGLTKVDAVDVKPFRVKESPFHMECKLDQMIHLGQSNGSGNLAICEVVRFHVSEDAYLDGQILTGKIDHVGRNGGGFYTRSKGDALFEISMPRNNIGIGWDNLPAWVFELGFSKNELAQLALIEQLPSKPTQRQDINMPEVKALLATRSTSKAWDQLLG